MQDKFGRPIRNIRISVSDDCNLNCHYCHNEGQVANGALMTPSEIEQIVVIAKNLDIRKVKFTGGEPLLRKDIIDIINRCSKHMNDVSMTTNGTFPDTLPKKLFEAGLNRVNVSLDSFDRERFKEITGKDLLDRVLGFIKGAISAGMDPVKINIVPLKETNQDDLYDTVRLVWKLGAIPQIIELVDLNNNQYTDISNFENAVASGAESMRERSMHRRKIYSLKDTNGSLKEVEFVRPMHNTEFCANCSRIRVISSGLMKPCLMHNNGLVDILTPMRKGAGMDELTEIFKTAVMNRTPYWRT